MTSVASVAAGDSRHSHSISGSSNLRSSFRQSSSSHTTPQQSRISSFASNSSSSSSFRNEEDAIIFEIGSRWLRAGFEGDSTPTCVVGFGPEESRRAGDYRGWLRGNLSEMPDSQMQPVEDAEDWVRDYELWRMDLRDVDLGLVEDKIERAFRETYNKYLLTDAGSSRLILVLPSVVPHPLLSSMLSTLFSRWRFPSITLLSTPAMSTAAAGLRSALVVDLGWAETTVTGVYEYREMTARRSTRAMKALQREMGKFLTSLAASNDHGSKSADQIAVPFEYCEEAVSRFAWCKAREDSDDSRPTSDVSQKTVSIPSPNNPSAKYIDVPFSYFSDPVENVLFARGIPDCELDDDEKPIPALIYNVLLSLSPDARGACMSRIVFIGGGSRIPGVRRRILQEVTALFKQYGWSHMRGKVIDLEIQRRKMQRLSLSQQKAEQPQQQPQTPSQSSTDNDSQGERDNEGEVDFVEQRLNRSKDRNLPFVHGVLREVDSLGPWAGASLVTSLKVRGLVEIEREKYLQHGLAGAYRDLNTHSHAADRRSGLRSGGDRSSWTLAGWG